LTPAFYQKLVDRCWRRSGSLLYRPNQRHSCCPHYSLRLDSTQFKPSKAQRQAINRFNRHIIGTTYPREAARLHPRTRTETRRRKNVFDLVERIHEPEAGVLKTPPQPDHVFTVTLEADTFTEEKYAIFENYQRIVHREPPNKISRDGFRRFLCDSPLTRGSVLNDDGRTRRPVGSFHQCYRIDGRLVAVGVLDLLPDCVSAVYFFYHEDIHWLNPGKLGALREIALAKEAGYRWWYPGYYVHGCAKMRYKIEYKPQQVLDPEDLRWYPLDENALKLFDKAHYVVFSRPMGEPPQGQPSGVVNGHDTHPEPSRPPDQLEQTPPQQEPSNNNNLNNGAQDETEEDDEEEDAFLLASNMPGIPSLHEIEELDRRGGMDDLVLRSDFSEHLILASHLVIWDTERAGQFGTLKSRIAELVAAVGPDLMGEVCVDFRKRAARY
jgi:arginine-tRNA-protein transferase